MRLKLTVLIASVVFACGCATAPASLSPVGVQLWHANEAVVAVGSLQHTVIELNKVEVCNGPIAASGSAACHPLVSDRNTRIVIDACAGAVKTIGQIPEGWRPATLTALDQIEALLDKPGQQSLKVYLQTARVVLLAIPDDPKPRSPAAKLIPRFGGV